MGHFHPFPPIKSPILQRLHRSGQNQAERIAEAQAKRAVLHAKRAEAARKAEVCVANAEILDENREFTEEICLFVDRRKPNAEKRSRKSSMPTCLVS
eukprot:scaffold859_cov306-Pinguiococcus_pyrenoidosus.AAC.5